MKYFLPSIQVVVVEVQGDIVQDPTALGAEMDEVWDEDNSRPLDPGISRGAIRLKPLRMFSQSPLFFHSIFSTPTKTSEYRYHLKVNRNQENQLLKC